MDLRTRRRALMAQGGSEPAYEHGTWEDLLQKIDNGTYATEYAVGETLPFVINDTDYQAQIVAFDTDTLENSTDKAAVSFVAVKLYNDYKRFNPAYASGTEGTGSIGGWGKSELRAWLASTYWGYIPTIIKNRICSVQKYSRIFNTSEAQVNNDPTNDLLWVPSYREMFGSTIVESSGSVYTGWFSNNNRRTKIRYSSARAYYTRSAYNDNGFYTVTTAGSANDASSQSTSTGLCVGFCVN